MSRPVGLSLEEALEIAKGRILPAGFKPEDYLIVGDKVPFRIASMIVKDALFLMKISQDLLYGNQD